MTTATEAQEPERLELTLTRIIDAPRQLVWRAWTDAEHAKHWGPVGFTVDYTGREVRPGGAWRARLRPDDGGPDLFQTGMFREVVEPERLVFTFAWLGEDGTPGDEMLITVTLEDDGGKTKLTLHQVGFPSATARDGHAAGWGEGLDNLADYLRAEGGTLA